MSNALVRRGQGDLPDLFVADFGIGGLAAGQALLEQARQPTAYFDCRSLLSQLQFAD